MSVAPSDGRMLYDDARPLDDDETVTETIELADGTTILGADPFAPVDVTRVDGKDYKPITITIKTY